MKKINFIFGALLVLLFSCENPEIEMSESSSTTNTSTINTISSSNSISLYDEIVKLEDVNEQILVASALSPQEMYELWLVKIDNYKANNRTTNLQLEFFDQLKSILEPNVFIENSAERNNIDKENLYTKAVLAFGEDEADYFLNNVENINHRIAYFASGKVLSNPKIIEACNCNKNGNCKRITGISVVGISWEYGECMLGDCYRETYFFRLIESSNTGRCKY